MYGFFYPENNERFLASLSFNSVEEAVAYFKDKRAMWDAIQPQNPADAAAFMNPLSGAIVVVRKLPEPRHEWHRSVGETK